MVAFNPAILLAEGKPPATPPLFLSVALNAGAPEYVLCAGNTQGLVFSTPATLPPATGGMIDCAFSPDGTKCAILAATATNGLTTYNITTNPPTLITQKTPPGAPTGIAWSPDGRFIAVCYGGAGGNIDFVVYDTSNAYATLTAPGSGAPANTPAHIAFNAQSNRILMSDNTNATIYQYSLTGTTLAALSNIAAPSAQCKRMKFSSDGQVLVCALANSPGLDTYAVTSSGTVFTKNTATTSTFSSCNDVAINAAKSLILCGTQLTPFYRVYDYPALTKHADPAVLPSGAPKGIAFSKDETESLLSGNFANQIVGYTLSGPTQFVRNVPGFSSNMGSCKVA